MENQEKRKLKLDNAKDVSAQKICVVYTSPYGTTREVAEAIATTLREGGAIVETQWIKNVKDLQNHDAIIIGSAIHYDRWMREATGFVMINQEILRKMPVAYFFTCLVLSSKSEKSEYKALKYSDRLRSLAPQVRPVSVGRFAGVLNYSKMHFILGLFFKVISLFTGVQEGDYRDWHTIKTWSKDVYYQLTGAPLVE